MASQRWVFVHSCLTISELTKKKIIKNKRVDRKLVPKKSKFNLNSCLKYTFTELLPTRNLVLRSCVPWPNVYLVPLRRLWARLWGGEETSIRGRDHVTAKIELDLCLILAYNLHVDPSSMQEKLAHGGLPTRRLSLSRSIVTELIMRSSDFLWS